MQLPDKVQIAVQALRQFDMRPERITLYSSLLFLRFRPATPPPLWGGSKAYLDFPAWLTGMFWGTVAVTAVGYLAWREHAANAPGRWTLAFLWQAVIWTAAGIFG